MHERIHLCLLDVEFSHNIYEAKSDKIGRHCTLLHGHLCFTALLCLRSGCPRPYVYQKHQKEL